MTHTGSETLPHFAEIKQYQALHIMRLIEIQQVEIKSRIKRYTAAIDLSAKLSEM